MPLLKLKNIHKRYQMGEHTVSALRGVSLEIEKGDFVAIMGPSGSGKSTLMQVMGLLDGPDEGEYQIEQKNVAGLTEDDLAILRLRWIGFIFQQFNLLPRMSALENVALPMLYSHKPERLQAAQSALETVGLGDRFHHRPNEMSGGQQQRVAIARALVNDPAIIFADEPTGNLDSKSEKEIMKILGDLNNQGITVIIVTHEEDIGRQAKRLIRMRDGEIQSDERLQNLSQDLSISDKKNLSAISSTAPKAHGKNFVQNFFQSFFQNFNQNFLQIFVQSFKALAVNKVRTVLSMLGIMIGVGSVVTMMALGRGAQKAIETELSALGANLLVLRPGALRSEGGARGQGGASTRLTIEDAQAIKNLVEGVKFTAPAVNGRGQVTYVDKNWSTSILGVSANYDESHACTPDVGRFFSEDENAKRLRVAVIGRTLVRELFNEANPIGEMIKINKISFRVIGILPEKGANAFQDQDDKIIIPVSTAMYRLLGKNYVDYIDIELNSSLKSEIAEEQIIKLMNQRHRIPNTQLRESFQIRNMADIQAALSSSTHIMTLLLSVIAAISLLVGGIGIMNIMLVSVTERTREIGLRKAVGARRWDILTQFLIEAIVVSFMGGSLGVFIAWLSTILLSAIAGWATSISVLSVVLAFGFSAGVGVVFGFYPARKASLLSPIAALRSE